MNRLIKFRAWSDKQTMVYDIDLNGFQYLNTFLKSTDSVLMQFTGLIDRNGVQIYEGDVIKCKDITMEGQELTYSGVVCFEDGWYSIETFVVDGYPSCFIPFNTGDLPLVIGNKFENPELL